MNTVYPALAKFDHGELPPLPQGWTWANLAVIAELKGGITKGQKRKSQDTLRSVPYLRVANVQRGYLDLSEIKQIEATEDEIKELTLVPGDVLFNEGGDRDKLGRGWIWRGEISECIHQNHVFRARLYLSDLQPRFISWYGNSFGQRYFISEGKQTTNLASINLTKLGALPIPLPPVNEQHRIVAAIETQFTRLDVAVAALKRAQANLKRYRASVLQAAACEGRLVPTEAELARAEGRSYEPADQLLQRILQERRMRWETEQLASMQAKGNVPNDDRWKSKYKEPVKPQTSELPELPEGWVWATMEPTGDEAEPPVQTDDSLRSQPGTHYRLVMTNPPFGKKSSVMVVNTEGEEERQALEVVRPDFWATTSNKQLNFLQHVKSLLEINGRAAIVIPDNVLFEGGAGETIRRRLLHECEVHTLLRLPTGIFYAQGVKANVLFFDRKRASETPWTRQLWMYDLRTNTHFTLKTKRLQRADLDEFVACFKAENRHARQPTWSEANPGGRWRAFTYDELMQRDKGNLDIFWLQDESQEDAAYLPEPDVIAADIVEDLRTALEQLEELAGDLSVADWPGHA